MFQKRLQKKQLTIFEIIQISFVVIYVHDVAFFINITALCDVCVVILAIMIGRGGSYCL